MKSGAIQTNFRLTSSSYHIQTDSWATGYNKEKDDDRSNFDCTGALFNRGLLSNGLQSNLETRAVHSLLVVDYSHAL